MNITDIKFRFKNKPRLKAIVSIEIEEKYILNDIKLIRCNSNELKLEFAKTADGRFSFLPLTNEARSEIEEIVITEYERIKS